MLYHSIDLWSETKERPRCLQYRGLKFIPAEVLVSRLCLRYSRILHYVCPPQHKLVLGMTLPTKSDAPAALDPNPVHVGSNEDPYCLTRSF